MVALYLVPITTRKLSKEARRIEPEVELIFLLPVLYGPVPLSHPIKYRIIHQNYDKKIKKEKIKQLVDLQI